MSIPQFRPPNLFLNPCAHVLVMSKRVVPRFQDLTAGEVSDMWLTAQLVGKKVEKHFNASSLTLAIQVSSTRQPPMPLQFPVSSFQLSHLLGSPEEHLEQPFILALSVDRDM